MEVKNSIRKLMQASHMSCLVVFKVIGEGLACRPEVATVDTLCNCLVWFELFACAFAYALEAGVWYGRPGMWYWSVRRTGAHALRLSYWLGFVPIAAWTTMLMCVRPASCTSYEMWRVNEAVWQGAPFDVVAVLTVGSLWGARISAWCAHRPSSPPPSQLPQYGIALLTLLFALPPQEVPLLYRRWLIVATCVQPFHLATAILSFGAWVNAWVLDPGLPLWLGATASGMACLIWVVRWARWAERGEWGDERSMPTGRLLRAFWTVASLAASDTATDFMHVRNSLAPRMDDTLKRSLRIWAVAWILLLPAYRRTSSIVLVTAHVVVMLGLHPSTPRGVLDALDAVVLVAWAAAASLTSFATQPVGESVALAAAFVLRYAVSGTPPDLRSRVTSVIDAGVVMFSAARLDASTCPHDRRTRRVGRAAGVGRAAAARHAAAVLASLAIAMIVGGALSAASSSGHVHTNFAGVAFCADERGVTKRVVRSIIDVQEAVRSHFPVRAVGGGHSWNGFSCPAPSPLPGWCAHARPWSPLIVDMKGMRSAWISGNAVVCDAGATMGDIDAYLEGIGMEMTRHWWREVTIGGAVATGVTHDGVGIRECVRRVTLVLADGSVKTMDATDPDWDVLFGSVGTFGVIVRVEALVQKRVSQMAVSEGNLSMADTWMADRVQSSYARVAPVCDRVIEWSWTWRNETEDAIFVRGGGAPPFGISLNNAVRLATTMPFHLLLIPSVYALAICGTIQRMAYDVQSSFGNYVQLYFYLECDRVNACAERGIGDKYGVFEPAYAMKRSYVRKGECSLEWSVPLDWLHLVDVHTVIRECAPIRAHPGKATLDYASRYAPWDTTPVVSWRHTYTLSQRRRMLDAMRRHGADCAFLPQGLD